jgi:hypothetical protein
MLNIIVPEEKIISLLCENGFLKEWDDQDRQAIERATARLLELLAEHVEGSS